MATSYTILVENESGANTHYAVFMEPPQTNDSHEFWMNVWFSSFVPNDGSFEIRTGTEIYAWVGTVPREPAPGVIVTSGMSLLARLGTEDVPGSTFDMQINQDFPTLTEITPAAPIGAFEVLTGDDITVPGNEYVLGVAKVNIRGQVAPVASMTPLENMNVQIFPKMKFLIAERQLVPGEIVDYRAISRDCAVVDFSSGEGAGKFFARVVQRQDGRFTVTYYDTLNDM